AVIASDAILTTHAVLVQPSVGGVEIDVTKEPTLGARRAEVERKRSLHQLAQQFGTANVAANLARARFGHGRHAMLSGTPRPRRPVGRSPEDRSAAGLARSAVGA